ncbi:glycosyltransferase [Effusibacillus consociatus]|uniref:Glycosyltransferase n=1 Tax=Effusibacillus consociatus TaxID=1117041 RepID=A0ABV9PW33_9BACL
MKLTLMGPVFDASGYAEAARSIIFGLADRGYTLRVIPRDWSQLDAGLPFLQKQKLIELCDSEILPEGPILQICIAQDFHPISGRINIGMTMSECDRLPPHWVEKCNQMDQIWVPSTFNQQTFFSSGVYKEKIKVVPLGVNVNRFHPAVPPMTLQERGRFVFLSNFEWIPRKGYDLLLSAYLEEFSGSDPVLLVIKAYDGSEFDPSGTKMHRTWNEMITNLGIKNPPALKLLTRGMSYDEIPSFYSAGHCYIIPTRGEGWNLPALEAMSTGIPIITTDWSAHLDFINDENGYLIGVERLEPIPKYGIPNDAVYDGARWAVPSLADTRKWMRFAVEHSEDIKEKGTRAREHVIRFWSTGKMLERILTLLGTMEG